MHKIVLVLLSFLFLQSVSVSGILYNGTDSFYNKIYDINNRGVIFDKNEMILNPNGIYFVPKNYKVKPIEYKIRPYMCLPSGFNDIFNSITGFNAKILLHF